MEGGKEKVEPSNFSETFAEAEAVFQEAVLKLQAICEDDKKSSKELVSEREKRSASASKDSSWTEISPVHGCCKRSPHHKVQSYQIPLVDRSMNQSLSYPPPPPPSPGFALKDSPSDSPTGFVQLSPCPPVVNEVSRPEDDKKDCVTGCHREVAFLYSDHNRQVGTFEENLQDAEGLEIVPVKCVRTNSSIDEPSTGPTSNPISPVETPSNPSAVSQPEVTAEPVTQYPTQPQVPIAQYQPAAAQPIIVTQQTSDSQQQQQEQQQQQSFDPAWYAWMHGMNNGPKNARYLVVSVVLLILSCFNPVVLLCGIPAFICALASLGEEELDTTYSMGVPMPRENRLAQTLNTGSLVCSIIGITSCCLLSTSIVILMLFLTGIGLI